MRVHRNPRARGRAFAAVFLITLGCSSTVTLPAADPPAPAESLEATRRLDFADRPQRGELITTVEYGDARGDVGFLPACRRDCPPPCPCSTPMQPAAYDVDDKGRLWILDNAKARLVVFSPSGELARAMRGGELLLRASDVQVSDGAAFVLSQNDHGRARLLSFVEAGEHERSPITFRGRAADAYRLWATGPRLFTTVFLQDGLSDEEVPVEITHDATRKASATEVPGRPFLDGWSLFRRYAGSRLIPLEVSSSEHGWRLTIELELVQSTGGRTEERRGHVSWESEIAPDGTFHLLLFAGTEGGNAVDGYWYLAVAPDGTVGEPIRLSGPLVRDDQQSRRLSLDADGDPVLMWAGRRGVRIERLPAEAL